MGQGSKPTSLHVRAFAAVLMCAGAMTFWPAAGSAMRLPPPPDPLLMIGHTTPLPFRLVADRRVFSAQRPLLNGKQTITPTVRQKPKIVPLPDTPKPAAKPERKVKANQARFAGRAALTMPRGKDTSKQRRAVVKVSSTKGKSQDRAPVNAEDAKPRATSPKLSRYLSPVSPREAAGSQPKPRRSVIRSQSLAGSGTGGSKPQAVRKRATIRALAITEVKPVATAVRLSRTERRRVARQLQSALKRVGCYLGAIDGIWGSGSKRAMRAFNNQVNSRLSVNSPSPLLVTIVNGRSGTVCGAAQPTQIVTAAKAAPSTAAERWIKRQRANLAAARELAPQTSVANNREKAERTAALAKRQAAARLAEQRAAAKRFEDAKKAEAERKAAIRRALARQRERRALLARAQAAKKAERDRIASARLERARVERERRAAEARRLAERQARDKQSRAPQASIAALSRQGEQAAASTSSTRVGTGVSATATTAADTASAATQPVTDTADTRSARAKTVPRSLPRRSATLRKTRRQVRRARLRARQRARQRRIARQARRARRRARVAASQFGNVVVVTRPGTRLSFAAPQYRAYRVPRGRVYGVQRRRLLPARAFRRSRQRVYTQRRARHRNAFRSFQRSWRVRVFESR